MNGKRRPTMEDNFKPEAVIDLFNESIKGMPKVRLLTQTRKNTIKRRVKEFTGETVREVIETACSSEFLNGKNDRGWRANFDWIMKPANFVKVIEGNYDNQKKENFDAIKDFGEL